MWLIATDEAGYGPKLGPLVIAATAWHIDLPSNRDVTPADVQASFREFQKPVNCDGLRVQIDDSKHVFRPGDPRSFDSLRLASTTIAELTGFQPKRFADAFEAWLQTINPDDQKSRETAPWLKRNGHVSFDWPTADCVTQVSKVWANSNAEPRAVSCRVITAKALNEYCSGGRNKLDLLSDATLQLVVDLIETLGIGEASVYCDRHGGRRYYAGVLQNAFSNERTTANVQVVDEDRRLSEYVVQRDSGRFRVAFTVKGDRFTPVAASSLIAKFIREVMMKRLNQYFRDHHDGQDVLVPTAGYPVDADRFLKQVDDIVRESKIDPDHLIRRR